jgi:hypothetical protein
MSAPSETTVDRPPKSSRPTTATPVYPAATAEIARRRSDLATDTHDAFQAFSKQVFAAGAHSTLALDVAAHTRE